MNWLDLINLSEVQVMEDFYEVKPWIEKEIMILSLFQNIPENKGAIAFGKQILAKIEECEQCNQQIVDVGDEKMA